jgi:hypothetical protein
MLRELNSMVMDAGRAALRLPALALCLLPDSPDGRGPVVDVPHPFCAVFAAAGCFFDVSRLSALLHRAGAGRLL